MLFLGGVAWHRMPFLSHLWPCSRYEIQHFTSAILSRSSPAPRTSRQSSCHFRWCTSNQRRHLPHLKFGQPDLFFILWHQPQFSGSYQSSNPPLCRAWFPVRSPSIPVPMSVGVSSLKDIISAALIMFPLSPQYHGILTYNARSDPRLRRPRPLSSSPYSLAFWINRLEPLEPPVHVTIPMTGKSTHSLG